MIVHIFQSGSTPYYGFTADRTGANLPPSDRGPWRHVGSEDMKRGEARVGLSAEDVAAVLACMSACFERRRVQGAIPFQPCLPRPATAPPTGVGWVHEIKHDGFRIVARREGDRLRLFTRNGYDFTIRFPKIAGAIVALPVRSCVVDGEAIVVNRDGLSDFELLRYCHLDRAAVLCAFDLIELDGFDVRQQPLTRSPMSSVTPATA